MNRTQISPLAGRISGFAPLLAAMALGWSSLSVQADLASATTDLNAQLLTFRAQETASATTPAPLPYPSYQASANDLVYGVYDVLQSKTFADQNAAAQAAVDLVTAALRGADVNSDNVPDAIRADANAIVGRVINAAILGAGLDDTGVNKVLQAVIGLNSTGAVKTQLTLGGKIVAVGQAIKSLDSNATAVGATAYTLATGIPGAASNAAKVQAVGALILRQLGNTEAVADKVPSFTASYLSSLASNADRDTAALTIAASVAATNPLAAGGTIGGRALTAPTDKNAATTLLRSVFTRAGLVTKGVPSAAATASVAAVVKAVSGDKAFGLGLFDSAVATGTPLARSVVNKAAVTSGVLQGLTSTSTFSNVDDIVNSIANLNGTNPTALKSTEYAGFTAYAAVGVDQNVGFLVQSLASRQSAAARAANPSLAVATDAVNRQAIAIYALRAVAATDPSAGYLIGQGVINSVATLVGTEGGTALSTYGSDAQKTALAVQLAVAVKANGELAGSVVAGVGSKLADGSLTARTDFAKSVIPYAPASTKNITFSLYNDIPVNANITAASYIASLAPKLTTSTYAYVPLAAAGVAAAKNSEAGAIAAAATNAAPILKTRAITIGYTVALSVDVERVGDIAQSIGDLLQPVVAFGTVGSSTATVQPYLPKVTSVGLLGYYLAAAIQTKPLVTTVNRVDELGELAAILAKVAIEKTAPSTAQTPAGAAATINAYKTALASIGTYLIASLSPTQLPNSSGQRADKADGLQYIIGSLIQAVTVLPGSLLTDAQKLSLIGRTGTTPSALEAALLVQAGTNTYYRSLVSAAFSDVINAFGTNGNIVRGNEEIATGVTGKYEIGNFLEQETPVTNVL